MMDNHRPLALSRPGTELAGVTITLEHLGAEAGEVLLIPVTARVAAGAESGDQLPFRATGPAPKGALCPAGRNLLDESSGRMHGQSLGAAGKLFVTCVLRWRVRCAFLGARA